LIGVDRKGLAHGQSDAIDSSLWITTPPSTNLCLVEEGQVKLDRSDILHGYPAKKIRDFLGHGRDGAFSYRDYCEVETFFGVADDYFGYDAKAVTAELLKRGWIIKGKGRDLKECTEDQNTAIMILTQIGKQSRIVSLNKRFSRAEGEAVVAELVERAKAINARDDLLCGISELRLYGSMLDPKVETVGDVDVAYELFYKQPPPGKRRSEWHIERAKQSGRNLQFREMRPDLLVIKRFQGLCEFLRKRCDDFQVVTFSDRPQFKVGSQQIPIPNMGTVVPVVRKLIQGVNRFYWL